MRIFQGVAVAGLLSVIALALGAGASLGDDDSGVRYWCKDNCRPDVGYRGSGPKEPDKILRRNLGRPPADSTGSRAGFVAQRIIPLTIAEEPRLRAMQMGAYWCGLLPTDRANGVYLRARSRQYGSVGYQRLSSKDKQRYLAAQLRGPNPIYISSVSRRLDPAYPGNGKCTGDQKRRWYARLATVKRDLIQGRLRISK